MRCTRCDTENPHQANFCFHCGTPFHGVHAGSRPEHPPRAGGDVKISDAVRRLMPDQFVRKLMASKGRVEGERRIVTILFSDVKGSTAMAEKLDPEEVMEIMNGAFEKMIAPITKYEGTLARLMGDAILAFFGAPVAHEDDPERACRAALEILEGVGGYARMLEREKGIEGFNVRVGINTGLVVVGEVGTDLRVEYTAMGDAVNIAARMETTAEPGTIRITETTQRIIRDKFETESLGGVEIKGKSKPVGVFCLRGVREAAVSGPSAGRLRSPLVGRKKELELLRQSLYGLDEGKASIVMVTGDAGIGKSRLVADARESAPGTIAWVKCRAVPYFTGTSYWMVKTLVCSLIGASPDAGPETLSASLEELFGRATARGEGGGATSPSDREIGEMRPFLSWLLDLPADDAAEARLRNLDGETFKASLRDAVINVITLRASVQPIAVSWEDLHWADPSSLALLEAILPVVRQAPVLFLLVFRNDSAPMAKIHDRTHAALGSLCTSIALRPLGKAESRTLLVNYLGKNVLPAKLRSEILEKTEGNAFYIEEILRSLIDTGVVVRRKDGKFSGVAAGSFSIPETIQGVITARLDCLAPEYRRILQASAVVGRNFRKSIVASVLDMKPGDALLEESMLELNRGDFIYPRTSSRQAGNEGRDQEYSFKHGVTQDVVYGSLLLPQRRSLHRRVGESFEKLLPRRREELAATLALHFGKGGKKGKALLYTLGAAERARSIYANREALLHFREALDLIEEDGDAGGKRGFIQESLGDIYGQIADYDAAIEAYDAALALNPASHARAVLSRKKGHVYEQWGRYPLAETCFQGALAGLDGEQDPAEEARSRIGLGRVFLRLDRVREAAEVSRDALRVMERLDDRVGIAEACNILGNIHVKENRLDEAVSAYARCRGIWEELGRLDGLAVTLNNLGHVYHLREEWTDAAVHYEKSLELSEKIGNRYGSARTSDNLGQVYAGLGDQEKAMECLKKAIDIFGEISREGGDVTPEMWMQSGNL